MALHSHYRHQGLHKTMKNAAIGRTTEDPIPFTVGDHVVIEKSEKRDKVKKVVFGDMYLLEETEGIFPRKALEWPD